MNERLQFFQEFLKNPLNVGAISPSSPALAEKMLAEVEADSKHIILEIGVGTGAITRILQTKIPNPNCYLGIEINEAFVECAHKEFPELKIVCGDAGEAEKIHAETRLGEVKYIISGLPFASLPGEISQTILSEVDKFMSKGCLFRTFQYVHGYYLPPAVKFRQRMQEKYGKVRRSRVVLKNVPPAYTLTWQT